jgi:hypothetical protein
MMEAMPHQARSLRRRSPRLIPRIILNHTEPVAFCDYFPLVLCTAQFTGCHKPLIRIPSVFIHSGGWAVDVILNIRCMV